MKSALDITALQTVKDHLQQFQFFLDCLVFGGSEFILDTFQQALSEIGIWDENLEV